MAEVWYADNCSNCGARNWVCGGDPQNVTGYGPDGVRCWKCGHCWSLHDDADMEAGDDLHCEDGRRFEEANP